MRGLDPVEKEVVRVLLDDTRNGELFLGARLDAFNRLQRRGLVRSFPCRCGRIGSEITPLGREVYRWVVLQPA
jgi:uncharacterized protein YjhX (UPF0386 family)